MWVKRKKLLLIVFAILLAGAVVVIYFCFRPPQTLSDIVGRQFMEPDQIIITNASNGNKKELKDKSRDELLKLLQETKIQNIEYIDMMDGGSFIQFFKADNFFILDIVGDDCFRITNPDDSSQLIVYHVDKESWKKIRDLIGLPY